MSFHIDVKLTAAKGCDDVLFRHSKNIHDILMILLQDEINEGTVDFAVHHYTKPDQAEGAVT